MNIHAFGLCLERLSEGQIERVRQWRNAPQINRYMIYQKQITPAQQLRWFRNLDPLKDFYFLIRREASYLGLINLKQVDWEKAQGEAGLFIADPTYWGTTAPVFSSLALLDTFLGKLGIRKIQAKIRADNPEALAYNEALGFVVEKKPPQVDHYLLGIDPGRYFQKAAPLRRLAQQLKKDPLHIEWQADDPAASFLKNRIRQVEALDKN